MTGGSIRAGFHTVVAVAFTWPLATCASWCLPNGTERTGTVAYFNLWTLRWNADRLGHGYAGYWDAPLFHPTRGAFALSEPQPLTGFVFAPIAAVTRNPTLAYDILVVAALALTGIAAARLCRRLGVSPWPAALAGVLAQVAPFLSNELGVLQLMMVFPVLFLADAVVAWFARPSWRWAAAAGWWTAATFLTCGYYGLFAVVVYGIAGLVVLVMLLARRRSFFTVRRFAEVASAGVIAAGLTLPVVLAQNDHTAGYARTDAQILGNSAAPGDFARVDEGLPARFTPWTLEEEGNPRLYPGSALVGLAVAGAVLVVRRRRPTVAVPAPDDRLDDDEHPGGADAAEVIAATPGDGVPWVFAGTAVVVAVLLSLGLHLSVFGWHPYGALRDLVPGYQDLRSPFRAGVIAQVLLAPFAAVALDALWRRGRDAGPVPLRRWGAIVAVAIALLGFVEVSPVPEPIVAAPTMGQGTDWVDWLAGDPRPAFGDGSVAHVPFPASGDYAEYEDTTAYLLAALDHGRPLVNGYSGLFPPSYNDLEVAMRKDFPDDASIRALARHRVSWVVVRRATLDEVARARFAAHADELQPAFDGREMTIYRFDPLGR